MKQISQAQALSSKPVVKKNVSRASKPVSQPVMRFATGNQLLARVLQGASASPAASDSIVLNPDEEDSDKTTSDVDDKAFSRSTYHSLVQAKGDHGALELAADGQAYTQFRCKRNLQLMAVNPLPPLPAPQFFHFFFSSSHRSSCPAHSPPQAWTQMLLASLGEALFFPQITNFSQSLRDTSARSVNVAFALESLWLWGFISSDLTKGQSSTTTSTAPFLK